MKRVIVIGSGISGMTCACALANKGYEVTVFEKQHMLGGYCQNFMRKGFRFGAAIHRIGGIYGKEHIDNIIKTLGVQKPLEWYRFKEVVRVEDIDLSMCNVDIVSQLKQMYPLDVESIEKFQNEIEKVNQLLNIIDKGSNQGVDKFTVDELMTLKKYRSISVDDFLNQIFKNEEIISILIAVSDAMPGGSVFAFTRMIAFANCGEYAYQPVGGAMKIIEILAERIKELGGMIYLNAPVDKVIIKDKKAIGVISKRKEYYADYVVSNCDMNNTIYRLIGEENVSSRIVKTMKDNFEESPSCMSVWLGLDQNLEALGYDPINLSYYPNKKSVLRDKEKLIGKGSVQSEGDFMLISLSGNNDTTSSPDGKSQMMIGMLVNWDYEGLAECRKAGKMEEYREKKKKVAMELVLKAEKFFPNLHEHIEIMEIASPATFERFTGNSKGAFGGYKGTPEMVENCGIIDGKQIVGNLFATGHWAGVGDGVIFTTDMAMRVADKIIRCDKRDDYYDFNRQISTNS